MIHRDDIEEQLQSLKDFEPKDSNLPILNTILEDIAKSGQYIFPWHFLKRLYIWKLQKVTSDFLETNLPLNAAGKQDTDTLNEMKKIKTMLLETFDKFLSAPFTLQRLTELLLSPQKHYKSTPKYFRALEKNIFVQTTIEPINASEVVVKSLKHSSQLDSGNLCVNGFSDFQRNEANIKNLKNLEYQTSSSMACDLTTDVKDPDKLSALNSAVVQKDNYLSNQNNLSIDICQMQNKHNKIANSNETERNEDELAKNLCNSNVQNDASLIDFEMTEQTNTDKEMKSSSEEESIN